ncbi:Gfo/Idh/MocA family protein [Anatilimnocola floriformis]|uniref:Gfo/Idh/MocA family protein n=1 Tax=Anatilimnocola floriformis TaxID=2948575 RepID=UPI0020C20B1B|nr:Gfo/Idh/MocA family oxidoreductase [Anatilimnocola floriformis]
MARHSVSRRSFLAASAAAMASTMACPLFVPRSAWGANERVVTGHIGLGGQGRGNLGPFISNCAGICDVDKDNAAKAAKMVEDKGGKCEVYGDYRKMLERKDIDAVVISTPDHWHALTTIHACEAGKDVYCEKPLTLTVAEGRKMVEAARKYKRVVQTGSQQRSSKEFHQACTLVRNGHIGKVHTVLVGLPKSNHPGEPVADSDPPPQLDYEMWLGPAPYRPYNSKRVHYNFRFFWDYSGGQMTNWGAHHIDIAQWGLGMDDTGPVEFEGTASFHPMKWHEVSETCRVTCTYANGVKMIVTQGKYDYNGKDIAGGTTFIGDKGQVWVNRGKIEASNPELLKLDLASMETKLYKSPGHHKDFVACIASRNNPICDVEIGHRTATVCHLANATTRLGKKLKWDPVAEKVDDADAAAILSRPYRSPWKLQLS